MLDRIIPAEAAHLRPLRGCEVCVIMNDGARHAGILTSIGKTSIVLNGSSSSAKFATNPAPRVQGGRSLRLPRRRNKQAGGADNASKPAKSAFGDDSGASQGGGALPRKRIVVPLKPIEAVLLL